MNKELVKKYKVEFDHWLYGGKLKISYNLKSWADIDKFYEISPFNENINDIYIVIDDEYVEFRKALAEGKTLQVCSGGNNFTDITLEEYFKHQYYKVGYPLRIKPEEPKFKVGDWVKHTELVSDYGGHILKIEEIDERNKPLGFVSLIGEGKTLHSNFAELWQPQQGEWCWFRDSRGEAVLKRFDQMCPIVPTNYIAKEGTISGNVEPFIGKLPSFLHVKE